MSRTRSPRQGGRAGTALVLALVLLVALLLLGLPFLFSQSASLSGTHAFSDNRLAQIGRDNAANLAAAVAAYAIGPALTAEAASAGVPPASWSSLPDDLSASTSAPAILQIGAASSGVQATPTTGPTTDDTDGSVAVVPSNLGVLPFPTPANPNQNKQSVYLGATISDESGKLDPNTMGPFLWQNLLRSAGITDWDDNQVYAQPTGPGQYQPDPDSYGQLAQALAHLRCTLPDRRITDIDQLLQAPTNNQTWNLLRWPLTRSELERLRPALSLHNPKPGRNGLIDLGTVVELDTAWHDTDWIDCNPEPHLPVALNPYSASTPFTCAGQYSTVLPIPLLADGTTIVGEATRGSGPHNVGMVDDWNGMGESGWSAHVVLGEGVYVQVAELANQGQALMIDAPPPLNIHQLSYLVRQALGSGTFPAANAGAANALNANVLPKPISAAGAPGTVTTIGSTWGATDRSQGQTGLNFVQSRPNPAGGLTFVDLLRFASPVSSGFELPPLGILSGGTFAIDATATVTDVAGNQVAQSSRRDLVQAVPQENLLERRWLTQGAFHALVAGRYGSHVQAWPVPYERLTTDANSNPIAPDDVDPAISGLSAKANTGLRPRPLPGFASLPNAKVFNTNFLQRPEWLYLQHVSVDWRLAFGNNASNPQLQQWATVFNAEELLTENLSQAPTQQTTSVTMVGCLDTGASNGPTQSDLHPDGFYHTVSTRMSYALVNPAGNGGNANVPTLTSWVVARPTSTTSAAAPGNASPLANTYEMDARHLSLWIQPQADWTAGIMPLWEMRMPTGNAGGQLIDASGNGPGGSWSTTPAVAGGNGWAQASMAGSNGSQNYCGLFYDANMRLLVLAMAPPSIEHTADDAIHVPPYNGYNGPAQLVDALSLGDNTTPAFLSLAPASVPATSQLTSFTQLFEPNRVLHCFLTPDAGKIPYFRRNQWYHIQVAIADDRPDGIALIVDGVAGTDVMKANPTSATLSNLGDHCTLPTLALTQAISYQKIQDGNPGDTANSPYLGNLTVGGVTLTPPGGTAVTLTATDLLPARGLVRIDDEYFIYSGISADGKTLQNVSRARRQDSWIQQGPAPLPTFPTTQVHAIGALVAPGGYRLNFNVGASPAKLYTGGCALNDPLYNGDPTVAANANGQVHYSQVWGVLATTGLPKYQPNTNFDAILPAAISIQLVNGALNQEFPQRGWVQIIDAQSGIAYDLMYTGYANNTLTLNTTAPGYNPGTVRGGAFSPPGIPANGIVVDPNNPPAVVLISIGATGPASPTTLGMYSWGPNAGIGDSLIAVQQTPDPGNPQQNGRVEWIHYHYIIDDTGTGAPAGGGFFIDTTGFQAALPGTTTADPAIGARGRGRTAWAGNVSELTPAPLDFTPTTFFSASSAVLPVQTEAVQAGHWLSTGDVITILPHLPNVLSTTTPLPKGIQMTVRYAATDGLPKNIGDTTGWVDSKNEWFSFTAPLPTPMLLNGLEFLVGDCWSALDLTNQNANITREPRGYLPRLDLWTDPSQASGTPAVAAPGRVFFGSVDLDRAPKTGWYATSPESDVVIDDVVAGQLSPINLLAQNGNASTAANVDDGNNNPNTGIPLPADIVAIFQNGTAANSIPASLAGLAGVTVESNTNIFPYTADGNMGLVAIDGEVFAYQTLSTADQQALIAATGQPVGSMLPQFARLVARGLLGSTAAIHTLNDGSGGPNTNLSAVRLPVGPVLQLQSSITADANGAFQWFKLSDQATSMNPAAATLYAPQAMIVNADGTTPEMLALIGPKIHHPEPPGGDPQQGEYCTATWIRGLYNCMNQATGGLPSWTAAANNATPPIVIGWWPRYASALPAIGTALTAQHLRSRTYSWLGLPMGIEGGYFDPQRVAALQAPFTGLPLAQVDVDDAAGSFVVEARALSYREPWTGGATAMDWSQQVPVQLVSTGSPVTDASAAFSTANDLAECFSANNQYQPVDGAELRLSWRYAKPPTIASPLDVYAAVAQGGNRAPAINAAQLRCLAPIRLLATERDR